MKKLDGFLDYLMILKPNSAEHYESGVRAVSKDMIKEGVINKPLEEMNIAELEIAILLILENDAFIKKNTVGKRMYSNAIKLYLSYLKETAHENGYVEIEKRILEDDSIETTEKEQLIKSRRGQGKFKAGLMAKYNNSCVVTGIQDSRLLIASHIKPWASSTNEERLDIENGLILSPLFDKLFDRGIISFEDTGKMLFSSSLNVDDISKFHIDLNRTYELLISKRMKNNLEYHRDAIFIR